MVMGANIGTSVTNTIVAMGTFIFISTIWAT
jgi:Na+/phosphate symporter